METKTANVSTPTVLIFSSPPGGAVDPSGPLSASLPQQTTIGNQLVLQVSSAQLKQLNTNPVQLLPSPGTNKFYFLQTLVVYYKIGTQQYQNVGTSLIEFKNNRFSAWQNDSLQILTNSIDSVYAQAGFGGYAYGSTTVVNSPIILTATSNPTDGDGDVTITLNYLTLTVPTS
ncbi:MAG: hypothetical protein KGL39_13110 [Patescibacteria group bacterium]|nr:hypothetical protein [Patescibacteria group bacterium]